MRQSAASLTTPSADWALIIVQLIPTTTFIMEVKIMNCSWYTRRPFKTMNKNKRHPNQRLQEKHLQGASFSWNLPSLPRRIFLAPALSERKTPRQQQDQHLLLPGGLCTSLQALPFKPSVARRPLPDRRNFHTGSLFLCHYYFLVPFITCFLHIQSFSSRGSIDHL